MSLEGPKPAKWVSTKKLRQACIENHTILARAHTNWTKKQAKDHRAHPRAHGGDSDPFILKDIKNTLFFTQQLHQNII